MKSKPLRRFADNIGTMILLSDNSPIDGYRLSRLNNFTNFDGKSKLPSFVKSFSNCYVGPVELLEIVTNEYRGVNYNIEIGKNQEGKETYMVYMLNPTWKDSVNNDINSATWLALVLPFLRAGGFDSEVNKEKRNRRTAPLPLDVTYWRGFEKQGIKFKWLDDILDSNTLSREFIDYYLINKEKFEGGLKIIDEVYPTSTKEFWGLRNKFQKAGWKNYDR